MNLCLVLLCVVISFVLKVQLINSWKTRLSKMEPQSVEALQKSKNERGQIFCKALMFSLVIAAVMVRSGEGACKSLLICSLSTTILYLLHPKEHWSVVSMHSIVDRQTWVSVHREMSLACYASLAVIAAAYLSSYRNA